jgi:hypothetical protein
MVHVARDMLTLSLDMPNVSMYIANVSLDISSDTEDMARLSHDVIHQIVSLNIVNVPGHRQSLSGQIKRIYIHGKLLPKQ